MSQKLINTRIGLKYDTISNWNVVASTFIPLKGEVIFYEIPTTDPNVDVNVSGITKPQTPPAILFKVGDGETTLANLPWGSAIAADVYAWAKNQSLLGGSNNGGTWTWSQDSSYAQEQAEVAAFVHKETATLKMKVDQVTLENFQSIYGRAYDPSIDSDKLGKYQISVSTDNGVTWTPSGDPFSITIETYSAGNGLDLTNNEFSVKTTSDYLDFDSNNGLDVVTSTVTYTPAADGAQANLTATNGLLTNNAISEIKGYVDAKAQEVNTVIGVVEKGTPNEGYLKSYQVTQDGVSVGADINIPKDFLVKSATSSIVTANDKAAGGRFENDDEYQVGDHYLDFIINVKEGSATDEHVYVNVKNIVDAYTAGTGLVLTGTEFSIDKYVGDISNATSGNGTDKFVDAKQVKDFVDSKITGAVQDANAYTDEAIADIVIPTIPTHNAGVGIEVTESGDDIDISVKLDNNHNESGHQGNTGSGLVATNNGLAIDDSLIFVLYSGGAGENDL